MKVLGISGLEKAASYKKSVCPSFTDAELGMVPGLDAAAVLVSDGKVIAAAEQERFSSSRHTGEFPVDAVRFCLSEAGISLFEIDEIAHSFNFDPLKNSYSANPASSAYFESVLSREVLLKQVRRDLPGFPTDHVVHVDHPMAHAAAAAYTSGWSECLVVVNGTIGDQESTSVYYFRDNKLEKLHCIGAQHSIGILHSLLSLHLGFNYDDQTVMALAPYGDPKRFRKFFSAAVTHCPDGSVAIPMLGLNATPEERETYAATRDYLDQHLVPRRAPADPLHTVHEDVAAALQECLEKATLHICEHFARKTGMRRLAVAGRIAHNTGVNAALARSTYFDEVYAQPVPGDAAAAMGAALNRCALAGKVANQRVAAPLFGPRYGKRDIEPALVRMNGKLHYKSYGSLQETCTAAANLIAEGRVIGWSRGRMELGSRALGNRSVLADPGHPNMRDRVNQMMNQRESYRPFAPACAIEEAHRWFDVPRGAEYPSMTCSVRVRPEMRDLLPAVTHINGSAQLQTVSVNDNPDFHALLVAVGDATGRRMVLNTNLSVNGQPIANTPEDALDTFLDSGVDHLFLENFQVSRRKG